MTQIETLNKWVLRGTPIIAVTTVDGELFTKAVAKEIGNRFNFLEWRLTTGILPLHEKAGETAALVNHNEDGNPPKDVTGEAAAALERALAFMPKDSVLFMQNINFLLESKDEAIRLTLVQLILDCRTAFKATGRALVLVCNDIQLPSGLANNVRDINIPYPTREELEAMLRKLATANEFPVIEENVAKASNGLLGMSIFTAENVAASCISQQGYDLVEIQKERIADINRTPGLRAELVRPMGRETVIGLDGVCDFIDAIQAGDEPIILPVLMDEVEKALAGSGSDSTGVTQDFTGQLLTNMEERNWRGSMFYGLGGSGKTETSKYAASKTGLLIWFDAGGMKSKYVGESESHFRIAFAKLHAIGGNGVFFMFTANGLMNIPAPLLRRLMNLWIYQQPTRAAQVKMWEYYLAKFNVPKQGIPAHRNWTGAEIKKCAGYAGGMLKNPDGSLWTLERCAKSITPIFDMMGEEVDTLYRQSSGKYLDPATGAVFKYEPKKPVTVEDVRKIQSKN